ncbi:hypothetical protein EYF80_030544 [Liparis tanakae]|uniref:Uncharacterized protein n=1 Tax=Liparis tanakae TaxID=230148 RepID=A0A4Z2H0H3_9TELE|nr:hypothetical protein EYF80_030544 [Liparis tanakae]
MLFPFPQRGVGSSSFPLGETPARPEEQRGGARMEVGGGGGGEEEERRRRPEQRMQGVFCCWRLERSHAASWPQSHVQTFTGDAVDTDDARGSLGTQAKASGSRES